MDEGFSATIDEIAGALPPGLAAGMPFKLWAGALRVMIGAGKVVVGPVGGPAVRAPGIVGGKAGGAGA